MTPPRWPSRDEARKNKWFSRRHQTSEPNRLAVEAWRETHGKEARKRRALERLQAQGSSAAGNPPAASFRSARPVPLEQGSPAAGDTPS